MKGALGFLWQLPQNLLGACIAVVLARAPGRIRRHGHVTIRYCFRRWGGISLGRFVFVHVDSDDHLVRHELGHCRQSECLGPLYLIVVGLPSIIWAMLFTFISRRGSAPEYSWFYTERWADSLGGLRDQSSRR